MRSLTSALKGGGDAGKPLPTVIKQFAGLQADIRLGELTLFASAPGVGKSVLAMLIAMGIKLPTLYVSADTSESDMAVRAIANLTGETVNVVDGFLREEPSFYDSVLHNGTNHIVFDFDSSPSTVHIREMAESFAVLYGDFPHLIVVDNLRNLYSEEEEARAMQHNCEDLRILAKDTGSSVLLLHHVTGYYENGDVTPPLGGLENKVGKFPALVITLSNGKLGDVKAAVVKSRKGKANAAGHIYTFVPLNTSVRRVG